MIKLGAIDIGTNSIRLLIAKVKNEEIVERFKMIETTRLGEDLQKTGKLSLDAMQRSIRALKKMVTIAKIKGLTTVPIIATSAVREAKNKMYFIENVKKEVQVDIEIISGKREATLGFMGVCRGIREKDEAILVIDIGGGSTELAFGNRFGIQYFKSLDMGAVKITEKFDVTDFKKMKQKIDQRIAPVMNQFNKLGRAKVIGIGGTVTTLAAVSMGLETYDADKVHRFNLSHSKVHDLLTLFCSKNLEERKKIRGLQPKRAEIIIAGTVILDRMIRQLNRNAIQVSEYDNLEGLIFEKYDKIKKIQCK
jgi:exopolyphosphatase/guanosine-5'-triphosphate,3'-diphosphate pyrophosphatase